MTSTFDSFDQSALGAFSESTLRARGGGLTIPYLLRLEVSDRIDFDASFATDQWMQRWWFHFGLATTETVHIERNVYELNFSFPGSMSYRTSLIYYNTTATKSSSHPEHVITEYTGADMWAQLSPAVLELWPRQDPDTADRIRCAGFALLTTSGVIDISDGPPDYYPDGHEYWIDNQPTKEAIPGSDPGFPTYRETIGDFDYHTDDWWKAIT